MQKTLIVAFKVRPEVGRGLAWQVLRDGVEMLERRTLSCQKDGNTIVAKHVHKEWERRTGACPENSFWDISVERMRFSNLTLEYSDAHLLSPETNFWDGLQFRNGECYFFILNKYTVVVTSLPSKQRVTVSFDVPDANADTMDMMRREFLNIRGQIESQLKLTQTFLRLLKAYEASPRNDVRIRRFKTKMGLEISKV